MPKTRFEFWQAKFESNVARDQKVEQQLRERGWTVRVIWECETRDSAALEKLLELAMSETTA